MESNSHTVDTDELIQIEKMCKERLESDANAAVETRHKDKNYIDKLERELKTCSRKIGYLQEQVNLRNIEVDCMSQTVQSLELKLADAGKLHEKYRLLSEELVQSDSKCSTLTQELKQRETELHNCSLHAEDLETSLSCIVLESQCEIETMRMEICVLEKRCIEAEGASKQAALDNANFAELLEEAEFKLQMAQDQISFLERENRELRNKQVRSERCAEELLSEDNWLQLINTMQAHMDSGLGQDWLAKLREELFRLKENGIYEEVLGPFLPKLDLVIASDETMKKMSNQIHECEAIIQKLEENLREEKQKAKDEAEDLIQEMAELRYQMTNMIEEERNRRACIEHAALQKIQELEAQVRKEQDKSFATASRSEKAGHLAKLRSTERSLDVELPQEIDSDCLSDCRSEKSVDAEASHDLCTADSRRPALIQWHLSAGNVSSEATTNIATERSSDKICSKHK